MYSVCAEVNAVKVQQALLTPEFDLDLETIPNTFDASTKILFLCSPNNPTGNLLSRDKINEILKRFYGLVVIDEAYLDFAKGKSFIHELAKYPNLVVLQTFSKAWGLAGLRLGMCFASEEFISLLLTRSNIHITSTPAPRNLCSMQWKALRSWNHRLKEIIKERNKLAKALSPGSM